MRATFKHLFVTFVIGWGMCFPVRAQSSGQPKPAPARSIPRMASFGQIRVGFSTQEDVAKRWGEGRVVTGGHSNSGRRWRVTGTPWVLHTDGFENSKRGLVVDALTLEEDKAASKRTPYARLGKSELGWLGEVTLGMSKEAVLEVLRRKNLPATIKGQELHVEAHGFHALVSSELRTWNALLEFNHDTLIRLRLDAGN